MYFLILIIISPTQKSFRTEDYLLPSKASCKSFLHYKTKQAKQHHRKATGVCLKDKVQEYPNLIIEN
jgi:hypothetical protein